MKKAEQNERKTHANLGLGGYFDVCYDVCFLYLADYE